MAYYILERRRDRDRHRGRDRDRERDRDRDRDRDRSRHHYERSRDHSRERSRDPKTTGPDLPPAPVQQSAMAPNVDMNAAIQAAMEAAQKISKVGRCYFVKSTVAPAPKPRASRFSSSVLTKKMYFPQQYPDIDYSVIFNGPYRMEIEAETHTTLSVGGTAVRSRGCT